MVNAKVPNFEREYSSAGLEHLPYKQRVLGSNPCTPTNKRSDYGSGRFFCLFRFSELPIRFIISAISISISSKHQADRKKMQSKIRSALHLL